MFHSSHVGSCLLLGWLMLLVTPCWLLTLNPTQDGSVQLSNLARSWLQQQQSLGDPGPLGGKSWTIPHRPLASIESGVNCWHKLTRTPTVACWGGISWKHKSIPSKRWPTEHMVISTCTSSPLLACFIWFTLLLPLYFLVLLHPHRNTEECVTAVPTVVSQSSCTLVIFKNDQAPIERRVLCILYSNQLFWRRIFNNSDLWFQGASHFSLFASYSYEWRCATLKS